jgi:Family of unknown function (DUF6868)
MNIETVCRVLLWCTVINYGILLIWFFVFMLAHDWMYQCHGRWFDLSVDQFDRSWLINERTGSPFR